MNWEAQQALIARARRDRAEAFAALGAAAAKALWTLGLKLRRAWVTVRARAEPHR